MTLDVYYTAVNAQTMVKHQQILRVEVKDRSGIVVIHVNLANQECYAHRVAQLKLVK
jgi:hypothetical protein